MNKDTKTIAVAVLGVAALFGGIFFVMHDAYAYSVSAPASYDALVMTGSATSVTSDHATLRASINAGGRKTNFWFEYATDPSVATSSVGFLATEKAAAGKGISPVEFATDVSGLAPATVYYFRAVSENASSTIRGEVASFSTK